jgi:hypothetical protein
MTREVLGSLPPRRRAVLVYRYGWNLDPDEVCGLVEGLSPRAYRKEIERGVAEVAKKMRLVDEGGWCETREPLLRAVVAGAADEDQERQARRHLANCRACATFVGRLNGHLHELGGIAAIGIVANPAALDPSTLAERAVGVIDRAKASIASAFGRGSEAAEQAAGTVVASGGTRGAGLAGAGAFAKLAGLGAVPKLVAACVGSSAAATACIAAGVVPGLEPDPEPSRPNSAKVRQVDVTPGETKRHAALPLAEEEPAPGPDPSPEPDPEPAPATPAPAGDEQTAAPAPAPAPEPQPEPVIEAPPPEVQEFEPMGEPVGGSPTSSGSTSASGGGGGSQSGGGSDFGP